MSQVEQNSQHQCDEKLFAYSKFYKGLFEAKYLLRKKMLQLAQRIIHFLRDLNEFKELMSLALKKVYWVVLSQ